jgi:indole-3-glycerol phosphate synthase
MTILQEIFAHKRQEVAQARQLTSETQVAATAMDAPPALDFVGALRVARAARTLTLKGSQTAAQGGVALIAEVKAASPSKGILVPDFDPVRLADVYVENGASAISVLTDERFFKGHLDYLRQVRSRHPSLPLLRKDFIYDSYQIYEARAAGADAILLIAAMLEPGNLADLHDLAAQLGMAALVEVHTAEELLMVLPVGPRLVGINNRDLHSFRVSLGVSLALRPMIPEDVVVVAESGIHNAADVLRMAEAGLHAILVGEALVTAPDTAAKVRELAGPARTSPNPLLVSLDAPLSDSGGEAPGRRRRKICEG